MKDYTEKRLYEVFPSRFFKGKMVNNEFVPLVDPKAEFRDKKTVFSKVKSYPKKQAN
jgi:hypothetical protein